MNLDLNDKIVLLGQSAGINSAAVYCWLLESGMMPKELHIYYAHFAEHSPDSFRFVADIIRHARKNFNNVKVKITSNRVLSFFDEQNMIPHPTASPCSMWLKIAPMVEYSAANGIEIDLIGYVKSEKKRIDKMHKAHGNDMFLRKGTPIDNHDDEWCFEIVKKHIGWYPAIYDLRWNNKGFCDYVQANLHRFDNYTQRKLIKKLGTNKRVFNHNNCLPCKNMYVDDMLAVEYFFPEYMTKANDLSVKLKAYWGRNANDYYTTFGREDYEPTQCENCKFD